VLVEKGSAATLTSEGLSELSRETRESNERAVALFGRAISVNAEFGPAHAGLAKAYVQRTDDLQLGTSWLDSAIAEGNRALQLDPSLLEGYLALGRAYRIKGWLSEELELWKGRVKLTPNDAVANERVGWVLWFTGRAREGLPWLRAAAALRPESAWVRFYLGNANLALGDHDEAQRSYRDALQIDPRHSSAQAGVIWSLLAAAKEDEARSELHRFQTGSFDNDRYPLKIADAEYFLGERESALVHANQALAEPVGRYWPRGILASTILGAVLWTADRKDAQQQLDRSEQIDHDRLEDGDQGYMAHFDRAAVAAIRGDSRAACSSLRAASVAGWRYGSLATRDPLFKNLRTDPEFRFTVRSAAPV
jgi:tetratricopeptide (TPR) repeat protein